MNNGTLNNGTINNSTGNGTSNANSGGKNIGLALALASNLFIGISFIITKKGLLSSEGHGSDSHSYLKNRLWWIGTITMIFGELSNFAAYSFAPPFLVTPMGALSVIIGAVLAHYFLNEKLGTVGKLGSALCLIGSTLIVLHAPEDEEVGTVDEIIKKAANIGFILYTLCAVGSSIFLMKVISPKYGRVHVTVYVAICSLMGSLSVVACKGLGVALKLTFQGTSQMKYISTYVFALSSGACIAVQINYFNKALDTFSTAVVTPVYYVFFTTATIIASTAMFGLNFPASEGTHYMASSFMGFLVIFAGVYLLSSDRNKSTFEALGDDKSLRGSRAGTSENIIGIERKVSLVKRSSDLVPTNENRDLDSIYSGKHTVENSD